MAKIQAIHERHPELFHYTDHEGLVGILTSQTLRATHYKFLNDNTELQMMRGELPERLFPFMKQKIVEVYQRSGLKKKQLIRNNGGTIAIARRESKHLSETFYRMAFEENPDGAALSIPFITSFCAHTDDQRYEQENGLLSQWRGYAKGGYAIVFNTKRLCDLYRSEGSQFYYQMSSTSDVVYQGQEEKFKEEFGDRIERIKEVFLNFIETGRWEVGEIYSDVIIMFSTMKHRGFIEEREVRTLVIPMTKAIVAEFKRMDPTYKISVKPMKKIYKREDGTPYIEMFDFDRKRRLPISRIIIGPQQDQDAAIREVRRLIENRRIKVRCSETPILWKE